MKLDLLLRVSFLVLSLVLPILPAEANIHISYSLQDLGAGRWKATYQVDNLNLSLDIVWLSVYFDYGLYDGLHIETPSLLSAQWDEEVWNPRLIDSLPIPGLYDLQAKTGGIPAGKTLAGLSISFDWLGEGMPIRDQYFEIFDDSADLQVPRVGVVTYIPEPATWSLLAAGVFLTSRRISRRQ